MWFANLCSSIGVNDLRVTRCWCERVAVYDKKHDFAFSRAEKIIFPRKNNSETFFALILCGASTFLLRIFYDDFFSPRSPQHKKKAFLSGVKNLLRFFSSFLLFWKPTQSSMLEASLWLTFVVPFQRLCKENGKKQAQKRYFFPFHKHEAFAERQISCSWISVFIASVNS